jgi:DNA polymerase III delta' subunit
VVATPANPFVTRGQSAALATVRLWLASHVPHAILIVGPPSVGKTTLALDLAAGLLCVATDPESRPCRSCRGCRLVDAGNHPDLHRLVPEGPGRQIVIGDARHPEPGSVRHLVGELALLPVEGGSRVALVEEAHRLNEDAQNALLKTLEEPPAGVAILLCADDEDRILPTIRSRCARLRLGPVSTRAIEELVEETGAADAPTAARVARLAAGRSGLALAYASAPDAILARQEIARSVLDLLAVGPAGRLAAARDMLARAGEMAEALAAPTAANPPDGTRRSRSRRLPLTVPPDPVARSVEPIDPSLPGTDEPDAAANPGRAGPSERRRGPGAPLCLARPAATC